MSNSKALVIRPSQSPEVRVARIERNEAMLKALLEFSGKVMDDLVLPIASSPIAQMIAGAGMIEWMQTWKIGTGEYGQIPQVGAHGYYYGEITKPLFSQGLATTLETAIITTETLRSLGGGGILQTIIGLFTKKAS